MVGIKGNKKRVVQYKNEYGLMFLFCDKVFNKIAEDLEQPVHNVKRYAEILYIQKYIIGSDVVNMQEITRVAEKLDLGYTYNTVRNMVLKMNEMGLCDSRANHFVFNDDARNFIKRFGYWLHWNTVNFHSIVVDGKTILKQQQLAREKRIAENKRKKRLKKA